MARELSEVLEDSKAIVVVEWGDVVSDVLPVEHIAVTLERTDKGEDLRSISVKYPEKFAYLFKEVK